MNFISWLLVYLEEVEGKKYTKRQLINHLKSLFGYQLKEENNRITGPKNCPSQKPTFNYEQIN